MLDRVTIENFRCFKSVDVPLRPLTVLIGSNDSGKSSLLQALVCLSGARQPPNPTDFWRLNGSLQISVAGYSGGGRKNIFEFGQRTGVLGAIRSALFDTPSAGPSMTSAAVPDEDAPPQLAGNGQWVPALIDHLLRTDRTRFFEYVKMACRFVPGLEDVQIRVPHADHLRIDLKIDNCLEIPADQASVGVRLMLFYLALAYHPQPPELVLIEEPERGVHPKRLGDIVGLLRGLTKGEHGSEPVQVVLTTHSPYLLDSVRPDEDQVLVCRRNEDGSRSVDPVDEGKLRVFMDEFQLGEIWFNEGEEQLVETAD